MLIIIYTKKAGDSPALKNLRFFSYFGKTLNQFLTRMILTSYKYSLEIFWYISLFLIKNPDVLEAYTRKAQEYLLSTLK